MGRAPKPRSVAAEALTLYCRLGDKVRQMRRDLAHLRAENGQLREDVAEQAEAIRHLRAIVRELEEQRTNAAA
jgi:hypothetical protein